jgi:hypothetical protein
MVLLRTIDFDPAEGRVFKKDGIFVTSRTALNERQISYITEKKILVIPGGRETSFFEKLLVVVMANSQTFIIRPEESTRIMSHDYNFFLM